MQFFVFRLLLWRAVNWLPRIYNDKLTAFGFFCLPPTLFMAHLAPCLTLTRRPCFYNRQFFEVFLLCSVQVTEFQLEYLMHACSSDFVHYWNMKLFPSLIHQVRIQGAGGRVSPSAQVRLVIRLQTSTCSQQWNSQILVSGSSFPNSCSFERICNYLYSDSCPVKMQFVRAIVEHVNDWTCYPV